MKCVYCGKGFDNGVQVMYPIDPKGMEGRRWACEDCLSLRKLAKKYGITVDKLKRNLTRVGAARRARKLKVKER